MRRSVTALVLGLLFSVIALPFAAPASAADAAAEQHFINLINAERTTRGFPPWCCAPR